MKKKVKTIRVSELLKYLDEVKQVVTKETDFVPIVCFDNDCIIANNNIAEYKINFESDFESCIVHYDKLMNLLKSMNHKNKITLEQKDNKFVIYHKSTGNKNRSSSLPTIILNEPYSQIEAEQETDAVDKLPSDFVKGISKCLPILPKESIRFDLNLMAVAKDKIVVSDDARVCRYAMESSLSDNTFYLSKNHIDIFLSGEFEKYYCDKKLIKFVGPESIATLSLPYEVSYPVIDDSIYKTDTNINLRLKKKRFLSELDRTIIFAEGSNDSLKKARLEVSEGKYYITAKNEYGRNKEFGRVKIREEIEFNFNPVYLRQGLGNFKSDEITINISSFHTGHRLIIKEDNFDFVLATYAK